MDRRIAVRSGPHRRHRDVGQDRRRTAGGHRRLLRRPTVGAPRPARRRRVPRRDKRSKQAHAAAVPVCGHAPGAPVDRRGRRRPAGSWPCTDSERQKVPLYRRSTRCRLDFAQSRSICRASATPASRSGPRHYARFFAAASHRPARRARAGSRPLDRQQPRRTGGARDRAAPPRPRRPTRPARAGPGLAAPTWVGAAAAANATRAWPGPARRPARLLMGSFGSSSPARTRGGEPPASTSSCAHHTPAGRAAFYAAARHIYLDEPHGKDGFWPRLATLEAEAPSSGANETSWCRSASPGTSQMPYQTPGQLELDCGHVPQIECPTVTNDAIATFFSRTPALALRAIPGRSQEPGTGGGEDARPPWPDTAASA